ncbi:MAG TPA: fused MFS/spermidine synthase [Candidatus Acidoferrum sp.]|nr:fused MFS/spermidine synthase [Candidatus Acidoferrum sp.]
MPTLPVLLLLCLDLLIFIAAGFLWDSSPRKQENLLLSTLFLCSGMPALIYQVVWQRVLFGIYGVNAESVAAVVSAFMLGLGLGGLLGGWLSSRFPRQALILFGLSELGVALFGLTSLKIFHWTAAFTTGASLLSVVVFSILLLVVPTLLMGATLPLLVEHFVSRSGRVGLSVSRLYFANTLGSAVACYVCATHLMRSFGLSGSVTVAACLNTIVGASAYLYGRREQTSGAAVTEFFKDPAKETPVVTLPKAVLLAALSGFLALGFEIVWFRVFSLASSDRAPAFALLLATYLGGIAAGAYLSEKFTQGAGAETVLRTMGVLLLAAGALSPFLPPLVAFLSHKNVSYLWSAPAFFAVAAMVGSVLPLLCQLSVAANEDAGRHVSLIYAANIAGSVAGSLGIGFVWLQYSGLRAVCLQLSVLGLLAGVLVLLMVSGRFSLKPAWTWVLVILSFAMVPVAAQSYRLLFEKLVFGQRRESNVPFAKTVENRNGVISVTVDNAVFGGGVYDGYYNTDPAHDVNVILRAFAVTGLHPAPKRMLMIGLASGSWGQIFANDPRVSRLDIVEINPGYLSLIPQYPMVQSLPLNPKVRLYVDDGRRWLLAHPEEKYDMIVVNSTYHWRDHSTTLLSREFLYLIRQHLNAGGIHYFNTTESDETIATALSVFPYAMRIVNFLAVSDSPLSLDQAKWLQSLAAFRIDGVPSFHVETPEGQRLLAAYAAFADTIHAPPRFFGMESDASLRARLGRQRIITDDNMGREWAPTADFPWRK